MFKNLQQLRIGKRLRASSLITLLLSGFASVIAIIIMIILIVRYNYTLTYYAFPQGDIALAMNEYAEVRSATRAIIGYNNESDIAVVMAQHDEAIEEVERYMAKIEETLSSADEKAAYEKMKSALEAFYAKDAEIVELGRTTDAERSSMAQELAIKELTPLYNAVDEEFSALMDENVKNGNTSQSQLLVMAVIFIILIVVLMFIAFIISNMLNTTTANGIIEPMQQLIGRLNEFTQGDISSPFPENDKDDEIGDMIKAVSNTTVKIQAIINDMNGLLGKMADGNFDIYSSCKEEYVGEFNGLLDATEKMADKLSATLSDMKNAADMVSVGATNLAEASQALAEGATDQAASTEELQAMVSEISSSLVKTADKANSAYERAEQCAQEVGKSHSEMEVMVDAMNKISETSQDISKIIVEIEDIASQTNLLSLNAAIEAARAGESGKGFAVVADQIRTLADQSAKSAVSTKQLIEESIAKVAIGSQSAVKTSEALSNVVELMQTISENSKDISGMVTKETESMKEADEGIIRISEVVQSNSATAQETSATSEELSAQAICMDEIVSKFILKNK